MTNRPCFLLGLAAVTALGLSARPAAAQQTLYVSVVGANQSGADSIQVYPPGGPGTFFAAISEPFGLAFDSAGSLYVAGEGNSVVQKYNTSTGTSTTFASGSGVIGQPRGMAFDSSGNLYVADAGYNTIESFTPGGVGTQFARDPGNLTEFDFPEGMAFDSHGNLFVANYLSSSIEKVTPGGDVSFFTDTGLNEAVGLAFDSAGNLYAANSDGNTIEKFDPNGVATQFAHDSGSGSVLDKPYGLAFDSAGNLFVTNANSGTIEEFDTNGVGRQFDSIGASSQPTFLAFTAAVPEPSAFAGLALGLGVLGLRFGKRDAV
jgi:DNA-binding beta-propeller fold protein YncE